MKIVILGAGAMGSMFGAMLAEAGESVVLLDVNEAHLRAMRTAGLRLETDRDERRVTALRACRREEGNGAPDLLVIFTKTVHIRTALAAARQLLGPRTFVLTLQNGLGNVEAITDFVPLDRVLVGETYGRPLGRSWPSPPPSTACAR